MTTYLPILKELQIFFDWKIVFPEEYSNAICDKKISSQNSLVIEKFFLDLLKEHIDVSNTDRRLSINHKFSSYLVGIFVLDKEIRIYSPFLHRELLLLKEIESNTDWPNAAGLEYSIFKKHVDKVASLETIKFPLDIAIVTKRYSLVDFFTDKRISDLKFKMDSLYDELMSRINEYRPSTIERVIDWGLLLIARYKTIHDHFLYFFSIVPMVTRVGDDGEGCKEILIDTIKRILDNDKLLRESKLKMQKLNELELALALSIILNFILLVVNILPPLVVKKIVSYLTFKIANKFVTENTTVKIEMAFAKNHSIDRDLSLMILKDFIPSEKHADTYTRNMLSIVKCFSKYVVIGSKNGAGIRRASISIKLSMLAHDLNIFSNEYLYEQIAPRLREIFLEAKKEQVFVYIDAEEYYLRDTFLTVLKKVLTDTVELNHFFEFGITVQAYLKDATKYLQEIESFAKHRQHSIVVRLVKGAYWNSEMQYAKEHSIDSLHFINKEETDIHYRQLIIYILERYPVLQLALASHNFADHVFAEYMKKEYYPSTALLEHQCLDMAFEALSYGMIRMGWVVRHDLPIGSPINGLSFIVKKNLMNAFQTGMMTTLRSLVDIEKITSPEDKLLDNIKTSTIYLDPALQNITYEYCHQNTPVQQIWCRNKNIDDAKMLENLFEQNDIVNRWQPNNIYNDIRYANGKEVIVSSYHQRETELGRIKFSSADDLNFACEQSHRCYNDGEWAKMSYLSRVAIILKVSESMYADKLRFTELIMYESGKKFADAINEIDSAINYLNYYAREEIRINRENRKIFSKGPWAIISASNGAISLSTGMIASALLGGNCVLYKSSERSSLVGEYLTKLFHSMGVPENVLIHLAGEPLLGDLLAGSPFIAGVSFAGTINVGTKIWQKCSEKLYHNKLYDTVFPVRCSVDIEGDNIVIVTSLADIENYIHDIIDSVFADSGRSRYRATRILVDSKVRELFLEKFYDAINVLSAGSNFEQCNFFTPVLNYQLYEQMISRVQKLEREVSEVGGKVLLSHHSSYKEKNIIGPVILEIPRDYALKNPGRTFLNPHIPLVYLIEFQKCDDIIKICNNTECLSACSVFSQSQKILDYLINKIEFSTLFVNKKIHPPVAGNIPYGGPKLSGTTPKIGSKNYLTLFHLSELVQSKKDVDQFERGSDYKFTLCRSDTSCDAREKKIENRILSICVLLNAIISNFEVLFKGEIQGDNKEILLQYRQWIIDNLKNFLSNRHINKSFSSNSSYNDYNLNECMALGIIYTARPHIKIFVHFLAALSTGSAVTILTRSKESFEWWSKIRSYAYAAGVKGDLFDVFMCTQDLLEKACAHGHLGVIFIDSSVDKLRETIKYISSTEKHISKFTKILTPYDSPDVRDFKQYLEQFVNIRTVA